MFGPAWNQHDEGKALEAIKQVEDEEELLKVIHKTKHFKVYIEAINRLKTIDALMKTVTDKAYVRSVRGYSKGSSGVAFCEHKKTTFDDMIKMFESASEITREEAFIFLTVMRGSAPPEKIAADPKGFERL